MSEHSEQTADDMPKPDMDDQANGERRVNELFVRPLVELGIGRPQNMAVKAFDRFKSSLAPRLWRLEASALVALREWVEAHPEAVRYNRWPPGPAVLMESKRHTPMTDALSERMVNIFKSPIGRRAVAEGWSPELHRAFVAVTSFPSEFRAKMIADEAAPNVQKMRSIEDRLARGQDVSKLDMDWRDRRLALMRKLEATSTGGSA